MQHDLPQRLLDYKKQIEELRSILAGKEKEKEQFLANFELGGSSTDYYCKNLLEKQSTELLNYQKTVDEY